MIGNHLLRQVLDVGGPLLGSQSADLDLGETALSSRTQKLLIEDLLAVLSGRAERVAHGGGLIGCSRIGSVSGGAVDLAGHLLNRARILIYLRRRTRRQHPSSK